MENRRVSPTVVVQSTKVIGVKKIKTFVESLSLYILKVSYDKTHGRVQVITGTRTYERKRNNPYKGYYPNGRL